MDYVSSVIKKAIKRIDGEMRFAFIIGAGLFFFIHLWFFTFQIWSNDDLSTSIFWNVEHFSSGRWANCIPYTTPFLLPVCSFVFCIIVYAAICSFVVSIVDAKNKIDIVLICALLVSFPTLSEIFGYGWLIEGFSLGILFSVLGIYAVKVVNNPLIGCVIGIIFIALSLGEYQCFISCSFMLAVIALFRMIISGDHNKIVIIKGIQYLVTGIMGFIVYYILNNIILSVKGMTMKSNYKGLDTMGKIDISEVPSLIGKCYASFIGYFLGQKFYYANTLIVVINIIVFFLLLFYLIYAIIVNHNILKSIIIIILTLLIPIGADIVDFSSNKVEATCLNIYAYVFVYILLIALNGAIYHEDEALAKKVISVLLSLSIMFSSSCVIYNNAMVTNIYYSRLNRYSLFSMNMANRLLAKIEEKQLVNVYNKEPMKLAIISGSGSFYNGQDYFDKFFLDEQGAKHKFNGFEGGVTGKRSISMQASRTFNNTLGTNFITCSQEEINEILLSDDFLEMKAWPQDDCLRIINGILVFSEVDGARINIKTDDSHMFVSLQTNYKNDLKLKWFFYSGNELLYQTDYVYNDEYDYDLAMNSKEVTSIRCSLYNDGFRYTYVRDLK